MLNFIVAVTIGMTVTPVPAPDYDVADMDFGISGFVGITPQPVEPRQAASSRSADRPVVAQNDASENLETQAAVTGQVNNVRPSGGLLGIAANYVGAPYRLGGTTPAAFDCSGYTSYVFRQIGIELPRSAAAQQAFAVPVSSPSPGDLVFWGYPAWHVGIYAGNGMVYDAGNPRTGVVYRSVFSGVSGYGRVL